MTHEEIERIGIGAPFMWNVDENQVATRADNLANAFRVNGLDADLTQTGGHGEWQYRLRREGKPMIVSETSYKTKEMALEGLKHHLLERG